MNILKITFTAIIIAFSTNAVGISMTKPLIIHSDKTTETFKVYGNCGMCKKTIEKAINSLKGVKSCNWGVDTKMMTVTFDEHKVSLDEIKQKIASVGYDTDDYKAPDNVYYKLMPCCQYKRPNN